MIAGELFAGVGGFALGLRRAGTETAWAVEIDEQARAVYRQHFPGVGLLGDVRAVEPKELEEVDVVTAGWPCQDLSVAGTRAGLAGARSGLFWEVIRVCRGLRPRWVWLENVPGLFSSDAGRDFAVVLGALGELGYRVAWRVLDSRYFGVPQRRRRVFIIGSLGDFSCAEVLFEPAGRAGDITTRREAGPEVARTVTSGAKGGRGHGKRSGEDRQTMTVAFDTYNQSVDCVTPSLRDPHGTFGDALPAVVGPMAGVDEVAYALRAYSHSCAKGDGRINQTLVPVVGGLTAWTVRSANNDVRAGHLVPTLRSNPRNNSNPATEAEMLVWLDRRQSGEFREYEDGVSPAISRRAGTGGGNVPMVGVRRLTPRECERLQGFPDDWTRWGVDENGAEVELSDSVRYRLIGNAVTVSVVGWIARRLAAAAEGKGKRS